jgi:CDP-glucose 4,6-dehydratase
MTFSYYKGKRVFVTGHTGFKGSWLSQALLMSGASVCGYALAPQKDEALFELLRLDSQMESHLADIRDLTALSSAVGRFKPHVVFHLAAQPLVLRGYAEPVLTYETNVMGTVNLLEALRAAEGVESVVNVTTDKVYLNDGRESGYMEADTLDGFDPYSNSKSCSELVTASYRRSFFAGGAPAISTLRAGNVIGGGDFAPDRIIPDCVRAARAREPISVRNPSSVRPYQHVLEPVFAYLQVAAQQAARPSLAGSYNIGPEYSDCLKTADLVGHFCELWGDGLAWRHAKAQDAPHESHLLMLDNAKIRTAFGWRPAMDARTAVEKAVLWYKAWSEGEDMAAVTQRQISDFAALAGSGGS